MQKLPVKKIFLLIFLFSLLLILSFQTLTSIFVFDAMRAYYYVKEFSSPDYEGRKPSTAGNIKALDFSEKILNDLGYTTIRQKFTALVPFLEEKPVFEILDENNQIVASFIHRVDFKESLSNYANGGNTISKFIIDGKSVYDIKNKIYSDSIVIVNNDYNGRADQDLAYIKANVKGILIPASKESIEKAFGFPGYNKGSFLNKKDKLIKLYITYDVYNILKSKCKKIEENLLVSENSRINLSLSLSFRYVQTENLIAKFNENNNNDYKRNYLGFSAHIDHLGKDPDGSYFPGALDNASGSAFVIEMAAVLAYYKEILSVNPIIILFNAEENGLCGSYHFVNSKFLDLSKLKLMNFDMVGSEEPVSYNILFYQGKKPAHPAKEFAIKLNSFGAQNNFKFYMDSISSNTDHYYFNEQGYSAISLNQFPESFYHTYKDTFDKVSLMELDELGKLIEKFVLENYTLKNQSFFNHYFMILLLLIAVSMKNNRKDNENF